MGDTYEEVARGHDVVGAAAPRVRGPIRGAWDLGIDLSGFGAPVEARDLPWEWLTGPCGVTGGIRFTEVAPGAGPDAPVQCIRSHPGARTAG